jgi:hypothetical protein
MTDTDVTFLPNYNKMDPVRLYVMILPCVPASLQALGRVGCAVAFSITSRDSSVASPRVMHYIFNSLSVPGYKKLITDITNLPNYNKLDLARSHASILPSPPPLSRLSL